jgi:predicted PurR-regulated permease PerM
VTTPRLRYTTASLVRALLIVGAWLLAVVALTRAATALVWFAEAAVIAALAYPVVEAASRRVPRWLVTLVLTVLGLAVVALLATTLFRELQHESSRLRVSAPAAARAIERSSGFGATARRFGLTPRVTTLADDVAGRFQIDTGHLGPLASKVGSNAAAVLVVVVLALMLMASGPSLIDGALGALAPDTASTTRELLARAHRRSYRYLGLMALRAVAFGLLGYGLARALGVHLPVTAGVWLGLWAFVPYVGLVVGGALLALLSALNSPEQTAVLLAAFVAVQFLDGWLVQSRIDRATLRFGILLTLASALIGFSLYGGGGLVVGVVLVEFAASMAADLGELRDEQGAPAVTAPSSPGPP